MILDRTCTVCGKKRQLEIADADYKAWKDGELIQRVFPDLSRDDREILISGTCPECWDILWALEKIEQ